MVDDLIVEYAGQIDVHMEKMMQIIQQNNWRTNPGILAGMKICIFRKGSNPMPTIVIGYAYFLILYTISYNKQTF